MSSVLKKNDADKLVFNYHPKSIQMETTAAAKGFVNLQNMPGAPSDFHIADIIAQQSGVEKLRKQNIETQVEEAVLEKLKEIEEPAYKQAYELGLIEGREKALEEHRGVLAERLSHLDSLLVELEQMKQNIVKENEIQFVKFIFQIAKRIAVREIQEQQEPIIELLNQLIAEVQSADNILIKLNPDDMQFIEELRSKNIKAVENLERVKIVPDRRVQRGGGYVVTNHGEIDASVEQRVERAWQAIQARLPQVDPGDPEDSGDSEGTGASSS